MGKALIISDTHGMKQSVSKVVSKYPFEKIFHCGDFCVDHTKEPFNRMLLVKGNNDYGANVPGERTVEWQGIRFFITHGHTYSVNSSLMGLKYRALEAKADVALFGHTHYPLCVQEDSLIFVNPGSLKSPRGFTNPTFAVLDVKEQQGQKRLAFTYYNELFQEVPSLSATFLL